MNYINCISCNTELKRSYDKICVNCKFDDKIMISLTEVKNKFKLSEDDLDRADLFKIVFIIKGNVGTKF